MLGEAVDALLKAIADDNRIAFTAAITIVGQRRTEFNEALGSLMGVTA